MESQILTQEDNIVQKQTQWASFSKKMLNSSAAFWLLIVVIGQWIFSFYIMKVYGESALAGNFKRWSEVLPVGIIPGDSVGNVSLGIHLVFAAIINLGGPLQLVPYVRKKFPKFHRVNGRVFAIACMLAATAGMILTFTRDNFGGIVGDIGNIGAAILIFLFSYLTWKNIKAKKLENHRKWSLRLFMVASATWFFRIGVLFWFATTGGIGIDSETFTGPFISFWSFGQYLLPLAILELYFIAQKRQATFRSLFTSVLVYAFTLLMTAGLFFVTMGYWIPLINK